MDRYEERLRTKEKKKAQTSDLDYAALVMQAKNDQQTERTTNTPEYQVKTKIKYFIFSCRTFWLFRIFRFCPYIFWIANCCGIPFCVYVCGCILTESLLPSSHVSNRFH